MVISALMQLAIAAPTGALFGAAYGTAIRVGYEIIFPALFGDKSTSGSVDKTLDKMQAFYQGVGGLEANAVGINVGMRNALKAIDADPELQELIKKNSNLDTQTIIVNLSGSSIKDTKESSQSSPSKVDTTGGLAERHRLARAAYAKAKHQNSVIKLDTLYFAVIQVTDGDMPWDRVVELLQKGNTFWFNINWNISFMSNRLLEHFRNIFNTEQTSTIYKSDDTEVKRAAALLKQEQEKYDLLGVNWNPVPTSTKSFRKPGQSVILERNKLSFQVGALTRRLRSNYSQWVAKMGSASGWKNQDSMLNLRSDLNRTIQKLFNMLYAYKWT